MYRRELYKVVLKRLRERRRFLQVLSGPRQTGKTTLIQQVMESLSFPAQYASADEPGLRGSGWIQEQWESMRFHMRSRRNSALLVLDEVQKISGWAETVKRLWDEDSRKGRNLKVVLLGSSPLLIQTGLTESLAGRFEVLRVPHWSYSEMREAFSWNLDHYLYFGGYPGAAPLARWPERWSRYILDSLIETTIARDILLMTRVDKPALLRSLFQLGCEYSGQILSYQKMLGQLQDAGNTTTLAHYLNLLSQAGMITGLQKYSGKRIRQRSSSPKLLVLNTALLTSTSRFSFASAKKDHNFWGRITESAVGAHLINSTAGSDCSVFYWREGDKEVDFVIQRGDVLVALEVKSGRNKGSLPGMDLFAKVARPQKRILVGGNGIPVDAFLRRPVIELLQEK